MMDAKCLVIFCVLLSANTINAYIKVEAGEDKTNQNVLDSFQKSIDDFRNLIDQLLAKTVSQVNEKQLEPVFEVIGDKLNRVNKAFQDLTAPSTTGKLK